MPNAMLRCMPAGFAGMVERAALDLAQTTVALLVGDDRPEGVA